MLKIGVIKTWKDVQKPLQDRYMTMEVSENIDNNKTQGIHSPVRQRLLSLREAATYLGRKEDSMRELVYSRVFPVIQMGEKSKMWIDRMDLDTWIDANKKYA